MDRAALPALCSGALSGPGDEVVSGVQVTSSANEIALCLPGMYDLHAAPYEQADIASNTNYDWKVMQGCILLAGSTLTGEFLKTFKGFPSSQRPATFTVDQAMEKMRQNLSRQ